MSFSLFSSLTPFTRQLVLLGRTNTPLFLSSLSSPLCMRACIHPFVRSLGGPRPRQAVPIEHSRESRRWWREEVRLFTGVGGTLWGEIRRSPPPWLARRRMDSRRTHTIVLSSYLGVDHMALISSRSTPARPPLIQSSVCRSCIYRSLSIYQSVCACVSLFGFCA